MMLRRWIASVTAIGAAIAAVSPGFANPSYSGLSPLTRILERGGKWTARDVARAKHLLRAGESIRTRTPRGMTVLMLAAKAGDLTLVRAALKGGVDVNARTQEGLTALWLAMASRDPQKVRLLLDAGADVDAVDSYGRTPLMMATTFRFREGARLLLARGADVNARNRNGHTALAYTEGHPGLTRLLVAHGACE
jgi:ankyrin repeat protein